MARPCVSKQLAMVCRIKSDSFDHQAVGGFVRYFPDVYVTTRWGPHCSLPGRCGLVLADKGDCVVHVVLHVPLLGHTEHLHTKRRTAPSHSRHRWLTHVSVLAIASSLRPPLVHVCVMLMLSVAAACNDFVCELPSKMRTIGALVQNMPPSSKRTLVQQNHGSLLTCLNTRFLSLGGRIRETGG